MPRSRTNSAGISKMEGVRRALGDLGSDAKPLKIKDYLDKHGIEMSASMISNYKSHLSRKAAGSSRITRKAAGRLTGGVSTEITLEEVRAVKQLADRIGADKVRRLAEVLSK